MAEASPVGLEPRRSPLHRFWEGLQYLILGVSVLAVIVPIGMIAYFLWDNAKEVLSLSFILEGPKKFMKEGGVWPAFVGTLYLMLGTLIFALPLGLMGAVYITEYGRTSKFTRVLRMAIMNLAGVPSVVYGLFGLGFFVLFIGGGIDKLFFSKTLPEPTFGTGAIVWASLTLALMILPVVIAASEEALLSVPDSFRQASLALGSTRWQMVKHVVLPSALPGILTGMILGLSRAAGETAPILLTGAAFYQKKLPENIHSPFMALPYHLFVLKTQVADVNERIPWGTAFVLLAIVLVMNGIASLFRARARASARW